MARAEIDTRPPFKSVREAVMLFGERVLVKEIYAHKLQHQVREEGSESGRVGELRAEIEATKQSLEKAREEAKLMACCVESLKEELQQTKKELQKVKRRELNLLKQMDGPEIEDFKFIANARAKDKEEEAKELQKKRYVKFASPPALARVIVNNDDDKPVETSPSLNKPKRKPLIPLVRWLFARRKGSHELDS